MTVAETRLGGLRRHLAEADCEAFVSVAPAANQYLTGFLGSTSALLVLPEEAVFFCDSRYIEQAQEQVEGYSVELVNEHVEQVIGAWLEKAGVNRIAFDPETLSVARYDKLVAACKGEWVPSGDVLTRLRRVKDEDEAGRIRAAAHLADGVLADMIDTLEAGMTERALAAAFEFAFKERGAAGPSFDTIALFGARSSLPHGMPGDRELAPGDIILLDFGCRRAGYCSDLTRTYAFATMPGDWFEDIYRCVLDAQEAALAAVRPGLTGAELDAVARNRIEAAGYGAFFGHGLGHGVGIEVHEAPRVAKSSKTVLEPGMVITIEPGIYLPGRGGVRIEDLVVVTEEGSEVLSTAPKELRILGR